MGVDMVQTYGMTVEEQEEVWTGWRQGRSLRAIGRDQGMPMHHVRRFLAQYGGVRPVPRQRSRRHLTAVEREEISRGLARGDSLRAIAGFLQRSHSTVSREVARNGGRQQYRAQQADASAWLRARRPKTSKLAADQVLRSHVQRCLAQDWSPPDQPPASARVSGRPADEGVPRNHLPVAVPAVPSGIAQGTAPASA